MQNAIFKKAGVAAGFNAPPSGCGGRRRVVAAAAEPKLIVFDSESRRRLQKGINIVADAVAVTLGPRGRNVVLESPYGVPQVINDGVSIARAIELEDKFENAGAQLIKEVAGRTNDSAGDGTTTASILAREMIHLGLQAVTAGANPTSLKSGIDKTCRHVLDVLKTKVTPIKGRHDIKSVASISAGNDEAIGEMIAAALDKVGANGVLSIEGGSTAETTVDVQEGMEIDRGYCSPQFVTHPERLVCEFDNCRVLITDHKIEQIRDIIPILEQVSKEGNPPLLIVAEDVSAEALATLVVNKLRGVLNVCAIKAPGFGERRKALLQDIAIVTGADFIAKDLGMTVDAVEFDQLGVARKATVHQTTTTLVADAASRDEIELRVKQLKKELSETDSVYDTEKLSERIAKLSGGVAVIKVGAATETELEDRKLRIEDAKNATFAALEEGIVPGGGAALVHLSELVPAFRDTLESEDERRGSDILMKAMRAPARLIASNAGVEGEVIVQRLLGQPFEMGYNAMTGEITDLISGGVIDPAKVTRNGLLNACSITGIMLTTQAVMVERPAAKQSKRGSPQSPMM
uniref:Uncharacterized protein n=1 Tax=Chlamydomonas euryale TaxID=1486919 RepID=A0A7R9V7G2_9CHLO|mmetsp:Transcript_20335/g.60448  ORF Transcript_20335/g.60448 Transcript_20335/m.60448 type:complete len:576 (+) Transcript_20335:44-1771(+)